MRINETKIVEMITVKDLPDGFQYIGEICGMDLVKELMLKLGGMNVYIPKVTSERIITPYIKSRYDLLNDSGISHVKINQILVNETGLAYSTIKKIIRNLNPQN